MNKKEVIMYAKKKKTFVTCKKTMFVTNGGSGIFLRRGDEYLSQIYTFIYIKYKITKIKQFI